MSAVRTWAVLDEIELWWCESGELQAELANYYALCASVGFVYGINLWRP